MGVAVRAHRSEFVKLDEGDAACRHIAQWPHWAENRLGNEPGHLTRDYLRKSPDSGRARWMGRPSLLPLVIASAICVQSRRHHGGHQPNTRTLPAALGDDFRDVRAVEFGPLVLRTIGHDFHRTGNALSAPDALFASFVPVNGSRDENEAGAKSWNATARKVGTGRTGPNCKSRSRAGSFRYGGSDGAASAARSFDLIGSQPSPAWVQRNSVNC
jgi:hypothetical protein